MESGDTIDRIKNNLTDKLTELPFIGIIETDRGVHCSYAIATNGITRIAFGSLDYSLDINCQQTSDAFLYARSQIVVASRVANLSAPIDCVTPDFFHPILCLLMHNTLNHSVLVRNYVFIQNKFLL
ncbi:aldolase/citrate lyase family protein [Arsenophonus endosymbiont of Aphis craccivora]|uniref:aldolase/citrate lyase family protein n=1 Tax=Arsenophonus endosymbiont of Aphis craccivora TaxID=1231049 RepID=UPI0021084EE4|nr:aldolase/citrate lyase family protein [Arsenophonus endosymbiont of Aphis craccivora]